ncbi:hypothetical protein NMG60_11017660 [Bertholletia excelsa]
MIMVDDAFMELDLSGYSHTSVDSFMDLDLSGHSTPTTTTTTTEDDYGCNWNNWSPVIDWGSLSGAGDDFHDLIESMMDDSTVQEGLESNSVSSAGTVAEDDGEMGCVTEDSKGLRLVHLLMAAAEALTGGNASRDLARVILVRLKDLASPTDGTNMERLAAHFTQALEGLLEGAGVHNKPLYPNGPHHLLDHHNQMDVLAAFQLLQDMSPYVKFGHFTANQAILEAVANDRRVHIVDFDIMEGIQWASLMQALVSRKDGPPAPHLRITAITRGGNGRRSIGTVQETGRRLTAFAASMGQPFSFHQCKLDSDETFRPSALKLVRGEALAFNCMLHLPHFSNRAPESVTSFLSGASGFVGRFMDSLHHFSAVYDSLEAGFPMQERARALVEQVFLGPRIAGSLAQFYRARGEDESWCSIGEFLGPWGFHPVNISFANHCQAKLLLGLFNDGYRVDELANNRLVLGWKSRRLLSASIWSLSDSDL